MKSFLIAAFAGAVAIAQSNDYFFRYVGGNAVTDGERLRGNISYPYFSPGVTPAPHNPADHFKRIYINATAPSVLYVVATNPHPPPVPGYYGLSNSEGISDAYRLVHSFGPEREGEGFRYLGWEVRRTSDGRALLRYAGDEDNEWRWIAVKETTNAGVDKWVPWYVKPTAANMANLTSWDYDIVDLELVEATGPVSSNAPGGVLE
ncbi:Band 3 anion exchange protein [Madurella mycetomatis]|uniref:Band 3 anion exchange protein n=1 Tax=Madurella mycetomatis TaxID=100816 RepID=A0A175W380_9PEZI|nr:Band 3 anion exchange protein [Madurella mycetomatis]